MTKKFTFEKVTPGNFLSRYDVFPNAQPLMAEMILNLIKENNNDDALHKLEHEGNLLKHNYYDLIKELSDLTFLKKKLILCPYYCDYDKNKNLFSKEKIQLNVLESNKTFIWVWDEGVITVFNEHHSSLNAIALSTNLDNLNEIKNILQKYILPNAEKKQKVQIISKNMDGYYLNDFSDISHELCKLNYSKDVIEELDHVIQDITEKSPCGRLTILSGQPGTGKTYIIRGLFNALKHDATFILVPPDLVTALGMPDLLGDMVGWREYSKLKGPMVFILEDADRCLVPRGSDNMSLISSLLNIGDGLIGEALDIRIIATTNALSEDVDNALLRPGRLCRNIRVGELSGTSLEDIKKHLDIEWFDAKSATLAELYNVKKQGNKYDNTKSKKKVGF